MYTLTTTGSEQDIRALATTLLGNDGAGDEPQRAFTQLYLSTRRLLGYLVDCMGLDADDDDPPTSTSTPLPRPPGSTAPSSTSLCGSNPRQGEPIGPEPPFWAIGAKSKVLCLARRPDSGLLPTKPWTGRQWGQGPPCQRHRRGFAINHEGQKCWYTQTATDPETTSYFLKA